MIKRQYKKFSKEFKLEAIRLADEPAKSVARMRAMAEGKPFFLKMNTGAGHGGSAARFERLKERTHDYAFALRIFGLVERESVLKLAEVGK